MNIYEAFVYEWTNTETGMKYIGSHKGHIDDGYISSSKYLLEDYNINPVSFVRKILAYGTVDDMRTLESSLLCEIDAAKSSLYYNKHNQNGKFICTGHNDETKDKMKRRIPWNKGKTGVYTKDTLQKMKEASAGRIIRPKGSKLSQETKDKLAQYKGEKHHFYGKKRPELAAKLIGSKRSDETKIKMKLAWGKRKLKNVQI
ncbi:Nuclease associated modular domain 3 [uncultured Caudovirales phage]|uniref:Nuclease associated modular domain 3 n=1 Tax=uncultured Caudovirales phage TaxID=2100421 RepID=A0A6J5Q8Y8_9CAUD|nr:Nuclease associated modular domain 3 [uncultured Caudovirales phage]CAB4176044.1 Nuclease associated modular domain 3 [uncultured Caudovirales phage]CAB4181467.1 Nuclease associated modular domain 3 [uncultured Caudovirales phage]CAB4189554.1 Nuclease associated modular domain 3 [uncultured Caudovirales phage]CAB4211246.1 Nuclease associated modular domain 3 [uncultured Caudovirales phage]